ncbi:Cytochrome c oxidase subunit 6A [Yarrowia sp. B02]|nr:Cytochrome c oxidase subunit 6A [Yarrowia sp. B02]
MFALRRVARPTTALRAPTLRNTTRNINQKVEEVLKDGPYKINKAGAEAYEAEYVATEKHAAHTSALWRKISIYICTPVILATCVNTYFVEAAHAEHREHLSHLSEEDFPPEYEFQNVRTKNFFWGDGDKTLFWNPAVNRHIRSD